MPITAEQLAALQTAEQDAFDAMGDAHYAQEEAAEKGDLDTAWAKQVEHDAAAAQWAELDARLSLVDPDSYGL